MKNKKMTDWQYKWLKNNVCSLLSQADNLRDVQLILTDLLTPAEFKELSLRWEIIKLLAQETPHRTIASRLGVSSSSIIRAATVLSNPKSVLHKKIPHSPLTIIGSLDQ